MVGEVVRRRGVVLFEDLKAERQVSRREKSRVDEGFSHPGIAAKH